MLRIVLFFLAHLAISLQANIYNNISLESLLDSYTEQERLAIIKDYHVIKSLVFYGDKDLSHRIYVASAGAPGAGKSTIMEKYLQQHPGSFPEEKQFVFVDPDVWTMRYMIHTYIPFLGPSSLVEYPDHKSAVKAAYTKWRNASNYISKKIANEAVEKGRFIAHGTTSTSCFVGKLYQDLQNQGYQIQLLLIAAPLDFRKKMLEIRNEKRMYYQSTLEDETQKANAFIERMPTYFAYADQLCIFWNTSFPLAYLPAAILRKNQEILVFDKQRFHSFIGYYETERKQLQLSHLPSFQQLLVEYCGIENADINIQSL